MTNFTQLWARQVRFGFYLLYHDLAWTYDAVSWLVSFGAWRDWQRAALPFVRGPNVLELAHGPGHMLLALNSAGFLQVGIELSQNMSHMARKRLLRAGAQASLVNGEAQSLPFNANIFDTVLVTFPTEFIVESQTLEAVHRVLKSDGRLVIVPEAQLTGSSLPERFIEWIYIITGQRHGYLMALEGQRPFTEKQRRPLEQRFKNAGFKVDVNRITLSHSTVTVLLAQKPGAERY